MSFKTQYIICFCLALVVFECKKDDEVTANNSIQTLVPTFIKTFGGSNNDSAQAIVSTSDGGYAILGFTQSIDGDITDATDTSFDYWVLKFNAADQLEWQRTYGGTADDKGKSIIQTQDGGYAILGTSQSSDGDVAINYGMQDYWLAKLDAFGNILWEKSFGYGGADSGISVTQTQDQGYIISGVLDVTASGGSGNTSRHAGGDYWILKLNPVGDILWSRYFGGNFSDIPQGVIETASNQLIIVGTSDSVDTDISTNIGSYDFWVIKLSNSGDLLWEKSYGGTEIDEARAIVASGDGNFIIAGDTRSSNANVSSNNGAADLWLIKIDTNGNLLWENTIGGTSFDVARALVKTTDNGFLLAGSSRSNTLDVALNKGQNDAWALKVDAEGKLLWQTTVGGSNIDFAYSITQLNNGSVIVVGDTASSDFDIELNKGFTDLLVFKMN